MYHSPIDRNAPATYWPWKGVRMDFKHTLIGFRADGRPIYLIGGGAPDDDTSDSDVDLDDGGTGDDDGEGDAGGSGGDSAALKAELEATKAEKLKLVASNKKAVAEAVRRREEAKKHAEQHAEQMAAVQKELAD